MTIVLFFFGLLLLIAGAELLVRGASKLAAVAGISKLVIGLTVVAYGTSFPELVVSSLSSIQGKADIAVGNVVGSNIFNVLFILGIAALILPLSISRQLIRLDVPIMIGVSLLFLLMALDRKIRPVEGAFLLFLGFLYTWWQIRTGKEQSLPDDYEEVPGMNGKASKRKTYLLNVGLIILGLLMLVVGSRWLVNGAVSIARSLGIGELVVALVLVAAGTSLPEAATSIVASIRKERDIAVGNIIGSNIFNILIVLGFSAAVSGKPLTVNHAALWFDIPVMTAVALACLPVFFTGLKIARWEGAVFLAYYIAYTIYLVLTATQHDSLMVYTHVMIWFVLPITILTLVITAAHAWRHQKRNA